MKSDPEQDETIGYPCHKKPSHTPSFGRRKFQRAIQVAFGIIRSLNLGIEIGVRVDLTFINELDDFVENRNPA